MTALTKARISEAVEPVVVLLEIAHPDLGDPVRVVADTDEFVHSGAVYVPCMFGFAALPQTDDRPPAASVWVDGIDPQLSNFLDDSGGAPGATFTIREVLRAEPDTSQTEITLVADTISYTEGRVNATLRLALDFQQPAVRARFDPARAPGLFS